MTDRRLSPNPELITQKKTRGANHRAVPILTASPTAPATGRPLYGEMLTCWIPSNGSRPSGTLTKG